MPMLIHDKDCLVYKNGTCTCSKESELLPCPFCGRIPSLPNGDGTQYEIWCDCGMAVSAVQISDLMTIEERMVDEFIDYRYDEIFVDRAKNEAINNWNRRLSDELTSADIINRGDV